MRAVSRLADVAGVADHVWSLNELAELGKPVAPAAYRKRSTGNP